MVSLSIFILAVFFVLGWRIISLHAGVYAGRIAGIIARRRLEKSLDVERGRIFDRNGNLMALDLSRKELVADPSVVVSNGAVDAVSSFMADSLKLNRAAIAKSLGDPARRFAYLGGYGTYIDVELADEIQKMNFPGVYLRDIYVRSYPRGSSMCHVLGYVNLERHGGAGVELQWDERLRGMRGLKVSEVNGRGGEMYDRRSLDIKPRRGCDVVLTLDQSVQYITEQALEAAVKEHDALAAWSIVERVKTGEILAMASVPAYDPNDFRALSSEQMRNRCIGQIYEPGSTFKITIIAAAIDAGVVTPSDVFDCENGMWIYEKRPLRDYHPYGELSVADIIKKSSNIGAAKIALLLGEQRVHGYLTSFGIGSRTGIDMPGEESGILRPLSKWSRLSLSRIAIGHEVAVTALQMLNAMCAIANGGVLMKPYIVRKVVCEDGSAVFENRPVILGKPISPRTAAIMRNMLLRTTEDGGTGRSARLDKYSVCGKTGTSQKAIAGGYSDFLNIASFVGFLPAENPELAIIVVVDEPKKSVRTGGAVSAPVFKAIAEQLVRYLNIPPSHAAQASVARERSRL